MVTAIKGIVMEIQANWPKFLGLCALILSGAANAQCDQNALAMVHACHWSNTVVDISYLLNLNFTGNKDDRQKIFYNVTNLDDNKIVIPNTMLTNASSKIEVPHAFLVTNLDETKANVPSVSRYRFNLYGVAYKSGSLIFPMQISIDFEIVPNNLYAEVFDDFDPHPLKAHYSYGDTTAIVHGSITSNIKYNSGFNSALNITANLSPNWNEAINLKKLSSTNCETFAVGRAGPYRNSGYPNPNLTDCHKASMVDEENFSFFQLKNDIAVTIDIPYVLDSYISTKNTYLKTMTNTYQFKP